MKASAPLALLALLVGFLSLGCDRGGGTVRQGRLSYNATDVFGDGTPALALAKAAGRGDVKEINSLIAAGANVNTVGKHGITPLWWAAWKQNYEGFAALLEKGANPNAQRAEGLPIIHLVTCRPDARLLDAALKHSGDPNLRDSQTGETPLFPAMLHGYKEHINLLLAAKANVNAQIPNSGRTIPMVAIGSSADYQLVYRLFQMGADPALKDNGGYTLADTIEIRSINASNNNDPWRAKVLEFLRSKGVTAKKPESK